MQTQLAHDLANSPDWLAVIRRYRGLFIGSFLFGPVLSVMLYIVAPRTYMAETVLSLNSRNLQILPADALIDPRSRDNLDLRSELDVISSRTLADRVALSLNPTDLRDASDRGLFGQVRADLQSLIRTYWPSLLDRLRTIDAARLPPIYEETVTDRILQGLKVSNDGRSYTVYIDFTAASPTLAQKVAEAYGQEYLAQQSDLHSATAKVANQWLAGKLTDLRISLEKSENAVQSYRRSIGMVDPNGSALRAQTLSSLNYQLEAARAVRLGAEARLEIAVTLRQLDGGIEAFQDVLASPIIQSLRKEETDVTRSIQEFESMGSIKNTDLPTLRIRRAFIQEQIDIETSRIVASLENEIKVAQKKEDQLRGDFMSAEQKSADMTESSIHLDQLEREAAANKAVYESFLNRYKQTIEQENIPTPETRILSHARLPNIPSNPRLAFYLMTGILGGGVLAGFVVVIRRWLDRSISTLGDLEGIASTPVLAMVPHPRKRFLSGFSRKACAYQSALRHLNATLRMFRRTRGAQITAFVSVQQHREEARLCLDLARIIALDGRSVVVVDAGTSESTFATPMLKRSQDVKRRRIEVEHFEEGLLSDTESSLSILSTASVSAFQQSAFDDVAWERLLSRMREQFEFILVYVRVTSDSVHAERFLSEVDATLFIATIGTTARKALSRASRHLALCGIPVVGSICLGAEESMAVLRSPWHVDPDQSAAVHVTRRRRMSRPGSLGGAGSEAVKIV